MNTYDVIIVGAGSVGSALFMMLSRYSEVGKVLLIDREFDVSGISADAANSQTLHAGDIETNYSDKKAYAARRSVNMLINYAHNVDYRAHKHLLYKIPKLTLAIGDEQCERIRAHYERVKKKYPKLQLLTSRDEIGRIEPLAVKGRDPQERIEALCVYDDWTAASFEGFTRSFHGKAANRPGYDRVRAKVKRAHRLPDDSSCVITDNGVYNCKFLVVNAGTDGVRILNDYDPHHNLASVEVGGSFFYAPLIMSSKLYMLQKPFEPFAPIHADLDIHYAGCRLGPTAKLLPHGAWRRWIKGAWTHITSSKKSHAWKYVRNLLALPEIRKYVLMNLAYDLPLIGGPLLHSEAKKLIPSVQPWQVKKLRNAGGSRAQLLDSHTGTPVLGGYSHHLPRAIFNLTISPGATACLSLAEEDMYFICNRLGFKFQYDDIVSELLTGPARTL